MKITSVEVRIKETPNSRMKATAEVVLDDCFKIRQIRIIDGDTGLFIAMPSKPKTNGGFQDMAHPLNQETREMFTDAILAKYKEVLEGQTETVE